MAVAAAAAGIPLSATVAANSTPTTPSNPYLHTPASGVLHPPPPLIPPSPYGYGCGTPYAQEPQYMQPPYGSMYQPYYAPNHHRHYPYHPSHQPYDAPYPHYEHNYQPQPPPNYYPAQAPPYVGLPPVAKPPNPTINPAPKAASPAKAENIATTPPNTAYITPEPPPHYHPRKR